MRRPPALEIFQEFLHSITHDFGVAHWRFDPCESATASGLRRIRGRGNKCFDLLNYDGGYPLDGGLPRLVARMRLQRIANCLQAPFSWTPERGRRVAGAKVLDDICGGEVVLDELWNHAFAGDEVGHGDVGDFNHALGDSIRERRDAIDDDKGIADEGGFNGGGAAGDDGGAGVEEGSAGIVDHSYSRAAVTGLRKLEHRIRFGRRRAWEQEG